MRGILADNDVEGYVRIIHVIWLSETWRDLWNGLGLSVESLSTLGLPHDSSDEVIWRTCQKENLVLVTANRNVSDPDSLEIVIRNEGLPDSLPVATLANPQRLTKDRPYAETVAERLLDRLIDINRFRGTGRIYVP
jgi:predicted nuclease of predicted toxin-antitoxin system